MRGEKMPDWEEFKVTLLVNARRRPSGRRGFDLPEQKMFTVMNGAPMSLTYPHAFVGHDKVSGTLARLSIPKEYTHGKQEFDDETCIQDCTCGRSTGCHWERHGR
jgi:hypothetical protein